MDETVVFIGQMRGHWGNFLFDCMARMWYVLQEEHSYRLAYCGVQIQENALSDPGTSYGRFMELLGIEPERLIEIVRPVRFRQVIIPELSVFPGTLCADGFTAVYRRAVENVGRMSGMPVYDKIYLTRRQMTVCKELGEKEIEAIFCRMGYTVIAPESLPIEEQIYLFSHCKEMVSMEGTASHNILFAQDGTKQIILRKQNYLNTRQIMYNDMMGIRPDYIDIFYEPYRGFPLNHDAGPFYTGVTSALRRYVNRRGYRFTLGENIRAAAARIGNFFVYTLKCVYYKYWLYRK